MPDPLSITFDFLANTENVFAVDTLLPALDVEDERIRSAATAALIHRRSPRGHVELVRRLHRLTPAMKSVVARNSSGMHNSLRQCLVHGDQELRANALDLIRWLEDFSLIPSLLTLLEDKAHPLRDAVIEVLRDLVDRLYDRLNPAAEIGPQPQPLRDAHRVREQVIAALDQSCAHFELHECECVVEALLILADVENYAIKKNIRQLGNPCRDVADRLLLTSTHPGVIAKIIEFMQLNYPPQKVFHAFRERSDPEFVSQLLRTWPRRLTESQQHNFRQIERLAWLSEERPQLDWIPPSLQPKLVSLLKHTGLPERKKLRVMEWLIKHGETEGRQAAAEALAADSNQAVQDIVIDGLYSEDVEVQAWATGQLRSKGIPQAFELLIERLDSPVPEVQEAARTELGDFNLKRLLDLFDQIDRSTCLLAGRLIQKIDPDVISKLRHEMLGPMRSKRIRATRLAYAIQVHDQVVDALIRQLDDADGMVRRTAIDILGRIPTPEAYHALQNMLEDSSARVREDAELALRRMAELLDARQGIAAQTQR